MISLPSKGETNNFTLPMGKLNFAEEANLFEKEVDFENQGFTGVL